MQLQDVDDRGAVAGREEGLMNPIGWCDETLNVFSGCDNNKDPSLCPLKRPRCYAQRMAQSRLRGKCGYPEDDPFRPGVFHPEQLDKLASWKKPRVIFMGSMGDTFHPAVEESDLLRLFNAIDTHYQHTYLFLTKRPAVMVERVKRLFGFPRAILPPNCWFGVSAWDQPSFERNVQTLSALPSPHRFVSLEPLLSRIDVNANLFCEPRWCNVIGQVIVGGESGPRAQPTHPDWIRAIREQCRDTGTPFYFKQWGDWGFTVEATHALNSTGQLREIEPFQDCEGDWPCRKRSKKYTGRKLDGVEHNELAWRK